MDPLFLLAAFVLGFGVRQVGLPPLVGFLAAGFVLNAAGMEGGETIDRFADAGVLLLLFTIGLKLRIKSLLRPQVWAGASLHMGITVVIFGLVILGLSAAGLAGFAGLDLKLALLVAFALSFSSTVFAVKVLEEKGEMSAVHGRVSIGILIMQDIIAVVFLTLSTGKFPSLWALALIPGLMLARPVLGFLLSRSGHGELLLLLGLLITLAAAKSFEIVDLKPDLGALIVGVILANHRKASELAKSLLGFKDLFLVGFFLSIGLSETPTLGSLGIAVLLVIAVPFKVALFFTLLTRFKLRSRTSLLASFSLANYSEFGLIVGAVGVSSGWIGSEWLVIIALALSITFVLASPLNTASNTIYGKIDHILKRFETKTRLPEDEPVDPGDAKIFVIGMGRVGVAAYDALREDHGDIVIGLDRDYRTVKENETAGRQVVLGDATDPDFWERVKPSGRGRMILLTLPDHQANLYIAMRFKEAGTHLYLAATAKYDDEAAELEAAGVNTAFNLYAEAGLGFADHVSEILKRE